MTSMWLFITLLFLAGCIGQAEQSQEINYKITPEQLKQMLENKDFVLINVHIPYQGEIPNTDYFIPYNKIDEFEKRFSKDDKIVIYCKSGSMSSYLYQRLRERGFKNVYELKGGMNAWVSKGFQLTYNTSYK